MRGEAAHVLMIGVGLETCTAIHLPEETVAPDLYLRPAALSFINAGIATAPSIRYAHAGTGGSIAIFRNSHHHSSGRKFMISADIGGCPYAAVALTDLLDAVYAALEADPRGTLRGQSCAVVHN